MTETLPTIDAHVQWAGGHYANFMTLQPQLPCEFTDHRTCKALSARFMADRKANLDAQAKAADDQQRQQVADLAQQKLDDAAKAQLELAALMRSEALRDAYYKREAAQAAVREIAASAIAKAQAVADDVAAAANAQLDKDLAKIQAGYDQAMQEANSADWSAKAKDKLNPPPPPAPVDPPAPVVPAAADPAAAASPSSAEAAPAAAGSSQEASAAAQEAPQGQ